MKWKPFAELRYEKLEEHSLLDVAGRGKPFGRTREKL
jgi:hypothetical protein